MSLSKLYLIKLEPSDGYDEGFGLQAALRNENRGQRRQGFHDARDLKRLCQFVCD